MSLCFLFVWVFPINNRNLADSLNGFSSCFLTNQISDLIAIISFCANLYFDELMSIKGQFGFIDNSFSQSGLADDNNGF